MADTGVEDGKPGILKGQNGYSVNIKV